MGLTAFNRARRRQAAQAETKPEPQADQHAELLEKAKSMGLSVRKNMKVETLETLIQEAGKAAE